ncbi:MAG: hypothetical protein ACFFD4_38405 [Candidatus Odinarchaeota archaeon]
MSNSPEIGRKDPESISSSYSVKITEINCILVMILAHNTRVPPFIQELRIITCPRTANRFSYQLLIREFTI